MKTHRLFLFAFALILAVSGCKKASVYKSESSSGMNDIGADTITASDMVHSSAAIEGKSDSAHRFIRTADLKFKAQNVLKTTYDIENITNRLGGYVAYTKLSSNILSTETKAISQDSSLVITRFSVSNDMTLRVPNTLLDSALKLISRNIKFLDYRIIKADNVALQLYAGKQTQKRVAKHQKRVSSAIDTKGGKLHETTEAEESLNQNQKEADNAEIENLTLEDQINRSTITLTIYQNEETRFEKIGNEKDIREYEPAIGTKILEAISNSWYILEAFIVFLFSFWTFILIAVICLISYKFYRKKKKNK